jgi:hypothetical protein
MATAPTLPIPPLVALQLIREGDAQATAAAIEALQDYNARLRLTLLRLLATP